MNFRLHYMITRKKLSPPANIADFNLDSPLSEKWSDKLSTQFGSEIETLIKEQNVTSSQINFFNPLVPPEGQIGVSHITWGGFPNVLTAGHGRQEALRIADRLESFTEVQDSDGNKITFNFRPQDEYLEWVIKRDEPTGKIKEIVFTCEGPEYWETLSVDSELLLSLYQKYAGPEVKLGDLQHTQDLYPLKMNDSLEPVIKKGDYNRWNKWNLSSAIHLTHPSNTLFAEINLAARSTILRKRGDTPITDAHDLICCSGYGAPNRDSDPTIGSSANSAVRDGNWVSLHDPVGIYIDGIDPSQFSKPDGSAILDFANEYWNTIRSSDDGKMILRASVKVPDNEMFNGKPLLLGDLLVNGEALQYGGQVADAITVGLYADIIPNGPKAVAFDCPNKCCTNPDNPDIDEVVPIEEDCKTETQALSLGETARSNRLTLLNKGYSRGTE